MNLGENLTTLSDALKNGTYKMQDYYNFAIGRVSKFLRDFYKKNGANGYFLKCDIRKFFDNIDHLVLKQKLSKVIEDERVLTLLYLLVF